MVSSGTMTVALRADRQRDRARLVATGPFDLAHAAAVRQAVADAERDLEGCRAVDVELAQLERIDGSGAVLLAGLLDRIDARGDAAIIVEIEQPGSGKADRPVSRSAGRAVQARGGRAGVLARIGSFAAELPRSVGERSGLHRALRGGSAEG